MNKFYFLCDLGNVKLEEENDSSWIMAMPYNTYVHPEYGEIKITPEFANIMANGVNENIRGQQLDIDYDHKKRTDEAAGWVKKAEARDDGLWLLVQWTKKAYDLIKEKAYKYFSPEFVDEWKHPVTGVTYKNVLFGGGITNRPFLKGIQPLNLSEMGIKDTENEKENIMDEAQFKELVALLGLDEGADFNAVISAVKELVNKAKEEKKPEEEGTPAAETVAQMSEDPRIKVLSELLEAQGNELHENRVNAAITRLSESASKNNVALSSPAVEAIRSLMSTNKSRAFTDSIETVISAIVNNGMVQLGESNAKGVSEAENNNVHTMQSKIDEYVKGGMSYTEAAIKAAEEMPDTYEAIKRGM